MCHWSWEWSPDTGSMAQQGQGVEKTHGMEAGSRFPPPHFRLTLPGPATAQVTFLGKGPRLQALTDGTKGQPRRGAQVR